MRDYCPIPLLTTLIGRDRKYPAKADNATFRMLMSKAMNDVPEKLKVICSRLSTAIEEAAAASTSPRNYLATGIRDEVKIYLS